MYTLQKLLTYKDPTMTQHYAHLRYESLKKAGDLAGELVKGLFESEEKDQGKTVSLKEG